LLACAARRDGVDLDDASALADLAGRIDAEFGFSENGEERVLLDGVEVTRTLRCEDTGNAASRIAALPAVRTALLAWQRRYRRPPGLIADGRDMGTVVFPDAGLKIFLEARPEERALRRYKQLNEKGNNATLDEILAEVRARDERDRTRAIAPLVPAEDALIIDSSDLDIEATVALILGQIHAKI
jgi:cytidylate kinase